jgi:hypothetical protein
MAHAIGSSVPHSGRALLAAAVGALVLTAAALFGLGGTGALHLLGVPTMQPPGIDACTISGASVSLAQGLDPLQQNPGDVLGRPLNYPRVWLVLAWLGLRPEHTPWLLAGFFLVFAAGALSLASLVRTRAQGALLALAVWSPAVWLGLERGNSDLFVFGLTAVALWLAAARPNLAAALVLLAAVAKLFPAFALFGFVTGNRRQRRAGLVAAALFAGYVAATFGDLAKIRAGTFHWNRIGYGIDQAAVTLAKNGASLPLLLGLAIGAALLLFAAGGWLRTRIRLPLGDGETNGAPDADITVGSDRGSRRRELAAVAMGFRAGAAVYVGSFCLGSSFDYRLMFLLPALPQLCLWSAALRGRWRWCARATLAAVVLLLWSMSWRAGLRSLFGSAGEGFGLLADELLSWLVFAALLVSAWLVVPDALLPRRWRGRPFVPVVVAPRELGGGRVAAPTIDHARPQAPGQVG